MADTPEFENVTAVAKANVYFDGKVVSHTIRLAGGARNTLGLIYPGEFDFGTDAAERMDIIAGHCRVRLDGSAAWQEYGPGTSFRVPGRSGFDIDELDPVALGPAPGVGQFPREIGLALGGALRVDVRRLLRHTLICRARADAVDGRDHDSSPYPTADES